MGKVIGYTLLAGTVVATAWVLKKMTPEERKDAVKSVVGFTTHCAGAAFGSAIGQNAADSLFGK